MDSLRQPFPARPSSKLAWVTSPPLLLEKTAPAVSFLSHPARRQAAEARRPEEQIPVTLSCSRYRERHVFLNQAVGNVLFIIFDSFPQTRLLASPHLRLHAQRTQSMFMLEAHKVLKIQNNGQK